MHKLFLTAGSLSGALSVMIGAFGAHKLKDYLLKVGRTEVFETAVKYQFYHTFALLFIGLLLLIKGDIKTLNYSGYCFITGVIIFSGSLYVLCLTNVSKWGAVTPIGGLFLIAGWIFALISIMKNF
ncbi:MAG: DUF423 domain-containing protein [Sporocytophaga sp.]|uniref:DUF423 domain-containing protein n=1 Tax=Sporocytophaga sp. TaxID=2231183 RepID=UPI001B1FD984|nr:DUF423 domain-containing protein [Sporocytophaga sp.]MBO9700847.1 DUF423 domain-containing protein [Sporocytophaga sp.]